MRRLRRFRPRRLALYKARRIATRLTSIEVTGDPVGLFSFDAELVKLIARTLKNEQAVAELLELR